MFYKIISLSPSKNLFNSLESSLNKISLMFFAMHMLSWGLYLLSLSITGIYKAEQLLLDDQTINTENIDTLRNTAFTLSWESLLGFTLCLLISLSTNPEYTHKK